MSDVLQTFSNGLVIPLTEIGVLSLEGRDAVAFIHRQLTNDIENLATNQATLAAYCSPQGRVLALLTVWKQDGHVLLAMPKDIVSAIQKRLRLFVLRDKVVISDVSNQYQILGICNGIKQIHKWFPDAIPTMLFAKENNEFGTLIRWFDSDNMPRWLFFTPKINQDVFLPTQLGNALLWEKMEIDAGIPRINQACQNRFIPQMLNLERLGGLSFTKGCYPGQEIVARVQYRGMVKSGLFKGFLVNPINHDLNIADGDALFNDAGEECGAVIMSVIDHEGLSLLAVLKLQDAQSGMIHVLNKNGPILMIFQ